MPSAPDPLSPHPLPGHPRVAFLRPLVSHPQIEVGDYTYYDDPGGPERFERENVLYLYPFVGDRLVIGRFCALGTGVRFLMNGANHPTGGVSTYPFPIFGAGWATALDRVMETPTRGDTLVGHDVWIGYEALVLPGVRIGSGAIVGARSVVTKDVPAYSVVAGNPARVVRQRFDDDTVARLLALAWWDWPVDKITRHVRALLATDVDALERAQ
jgi:virginiamycin A acetyltransferase